VVAGGTHPAATKDEIERKLGGAVPATIKVIAHNCRGDLSYLGQSSRGIPLYLNQAVMACDLKIGVGCIYPHPAAGFSGGSKIIMPGVCGLETTRIMHDYVQGAERRGGSIETALRQEMDEVAAMVGLDLLVNVVLNQERQIAALFVGDKTLAFQQGVAFAAELYRVNPVAEADIVVADMYPFDLNLQFAHDRGLWPLWQAGAKASKVVIAACPLGRGNHDLYPVSNPLWARFSRRLKNFQLRDFRQPLAKLKIMSELWRQKQLELRVLSPGITPEALKSVFPKATLYRSWPELLSQLESCHADLPVKVAVYKCAPLQMPVARHSSAAAQPFPSKQWARI
jgi:nickel-dependent lactate racemase